MSLPARDRAARELSGMAERTLRHPLRRSAEVVGPDSVDERVAVSLGVPDQLEPEPAAVRAGRGRHAADVDGTARVEQVDADLALGRGGIRDRSAAGERIGAVTAPCPDDL